MGKRTSIALLVMVVAAVHGWTIEADAANFTVTRTDDPSPVDGCNPGDCSFREAIADANNIDPTTTDTIVLSPGAIYEWDETVFALPPIVASPIVIQGNGATLRGTLDWNNRLLGVQAPGDLTIQHLTLEGGMQTSAGTGGAISNPSGTLTVIDSTLRDNVAGDAGAIQTGGALTVIRSRFENNNATAVSGSAGAIQVLSGSVSISDSTFIDNDAVQGGAVNLNTDAPATATIVRSHFEDNDAPKGGGAIFNGSSAALTVTASTFVTNTAADDSGEGGALFNNSSGDVSVDTTTFFQNTAAFRGGAISNDGDITITRSTIAGNTASGATTGDADGGGVHSQPPGTFEITDSTVSANRAEDSGGGLFLTGNDTVTRTTVTGNIADLGGDPTGDGGGIAGTAGTVLVEGSIVFGNSDAGSAAVLPDCRTTDVSSAGFNVLGASCATIGTDTASDPALGPLANNGGPTMTHMISTSSSAFNHNDSPTACGGTDQRGAPRPSGADCDSGAYELVMCVGLTVNRVGTTGNDTIVGTALADGVLAQGGNDTIRGGGGNDRICSGAGNDTVSGGTGADTVLGEAGVDTINGDADNDRVFGGTENDRIIGGTGVDALMGDAGDDRIAGGADRDRIRGDAGNDRLFGDAGNDSLNGSTGTDVCRGGSGTDAFGACETAVQ